MITVKGWLLVVCLSSGCTTVPNLPDQTRCEAIGTYILTHTLPASALYGRKSCTEYDVLVVSQSGNPPGANYLTAQ